MIRLVLFDIDGTLILSGGAGEKAFGHACSMEFDVPNATAHLQFAGRTDPSIVRDFFTRNHIEPSPENFRRFFDCYVFWLDYILSHSNGTVLPGVSRMIREFRSLADPPLMGLLTGNIHLGAQIKLTHYKLWHEFAMGGFGDDHEDRNCLAGIAHDRGQELLGEKLRGDQILVIGDTPRDIECAKAIKARVLAVATGNYKRDQLASYSPTWIADTLEALSVSDLMACSE
jgi:phosphoglycolate phosphatase